MLWVWSWSIKPKTLDVLSHEALQWGAWESVALKSNPTHMTKTQVSHHDPGLSCHSTWAPPKPSQSPNIVRFMLNFDRNDSGIERLGYSHVQVPHAHHRWLCYLGTLHLNPKPSQEWQLRSWFMGGPDILDLATAISINGTQAGTDSFPSISHHRCTSTPNSSLEVERLNSTPDTAHYLLS